jgi:hypothetical protein
MEKFLKIQIKTLKITNYKPKNIKTKQIQIEPEDQLIKKRIKTKNIKLKST